MLRYSSDSLGRAVVLLLYKCTLASHCSLLIFIGLFVGSGSSVWESCFCLAVWQPAVTEGTQGTEGQRGQRERLITLCPSVLIMPVEELA